VYLAQAWMAVLKLMLLGLRPPLLMPSNSLGTTAHQDTQVGE
jgi:hypothetical protein